MSSQQSITDWLRVMADDGTAADAAVGQLWDAYFARLVRLARDRLKAKPRPAGDEEDVALSAFDSFVRNAQNRRFARLNDRNDLWQILFMLTARKSADLIEKELTKKQGAGKVAHWSALAPADGSGAGPAFPADDPDPAEVAAVADGLEQMLNVLGDDELRKVAVWRMEGHTNAEIGELLGRSEAAVERKLHTIRTIYRAEGFWTAPPAG